MADDSNCGQSARRGEGAGVRLVEDEPAPVTLGVMLSDLVVETDGERDEVSEMDGVALAEGVTTGNTTATGTAELE